MLALILTILTLLGAAPQDPSAKPMNVVATTGMIADTAREVGGPRTRVTALMGEGVDPHLYKASPGDLRRLQDADLILFNGLHLEGRLADTLVRLARRQPTVQVTETIPENLLREPPELEGHYDPHVWFDPTLWVYVAERTRDALIERDPAGKDEYTANCARVVARLKTLDAWARAELARIPEQSRLIVTAHDAFGYFGRAYGLEVIGLQGISTDSEVSIQSINRLVDTLVSRRCRAVFVESSVPRKAVEALVEGCKSRGHTLTIGGELFSDAMGPDGTPEGTYEGMVRHNVRTIVEALAPAAPAPVHTPPSSATPEPAPR